MKKIFILFLSVIFLAGACQEDFPKRDIGLDPIDGEGIQGDLTQICIIERSCRTDAFYPDPTSSFMGERDELIVHYFHTHALPIYSLEIEENYFEAVCEACHICPSGDRFVVLTSADAVSTLLAHDFWLMDCEGQTNSIEMKFDATKCSDPWMQAINAPGIPTPEDIRKAIAQYLLEQGIDVYRIWEEEMVGQDCEACHCLSEVRYGIEIDEEDENKAVSIGFYK